MTLNIPQIAIQERGTYFTNPDLMYLQFFSSPLYGRLFIKYGDMNERHMHMNELLKKIYVMHWRSMHRPAGNNRGSAEHGHYDILFMIETAVYWIRKNTDEVISLHYYADYVTEFRKEPKKIAIDCIGELLKNKEHALYQLFGPFIERLQRINDISNTYKHSFITTEAHDTYIKQEPAVFCLELKRNDGTKTPVFHSYFLRQILNDYGDFFVFAREELKKFNGPALMTPQPEE